MNAFEIRTATPADAETVADYHARCFIKTYAPQMRSGDLRPPDLEGMRQQFHQWFQPGSEFETMVAVVDDSPIAHFTVRGNQLVHLFVDPEQQGRGLGRHLLAEAEAMIAAHGHSQLELHTRVDNFAAIAFYQAAGWTVTDRTIHTVEHGISYDEWILVKH